MGGKPTLLMCGLVSDYSREAETILDPFCGSGTTLVAAKKLGRHFLGFEISADYCAIARRRLDEVDAQPSLFAPKPEQLELP
jgi:site-specific DNA-methyltransferase (adenine-specific)